MRLLIQIVALYEVDAINNGSERKPRPGRAGAEADVRMSVDTAPQRRAAPFQTILNALA
jgi:hypothetical protein